MGIGTGMALASINGEIIRFTAKLIKVRGSYDALLNKTSPYANEHQILITAYNNAIDGLKQVRDYIDV